MKQTKKKWDWEVFKANHSKEHYEWFLENYKRKITEAQFITALQGLKEFRKGKSYKYAPLQSQTVLS